MTGPTLLVLMWQIGATRRRMWSCLWAAMETCWGLSRYAAPSEPYRKVSMFNALPYHEKSVAHVESENVMRCDRPCSNTTGSFPSSLAAGSLLPNRV